MLFVPFVRDLDVPGDLVQPVPVLVQPGDGVGDSVLGIADDLVVDEREREPQQTHGERSYAHVGGHATGLVQM
ncbi:hypothetical protein [Nonomuraea sp. KM88]|uniref:hypothetical protein n=1 Tax=Nonomuraea sp. KM88 TaxID=3457427 RepID=UPI003FCE8AA8